MSRTFDQAFNVPGPQTVADTVSENPSIHRFEVSVHGTHTAPASSLDTLSNVCSFLFRRRAIVRTLNRTKSRPSKL